MTNIRITTKKASLTFSVLLLRLLLGGGGGGWGGATLTCLKVGELEICTELRVPFSKNIAKLLERRLSINKMNVELEMKV